MKQRLSILLILIITGFASNAQDVQSNLDQFFTALSQNQDFVGNVLIAEKGRIIYEKSFGYADPSTRRPITLTTQFPVGSITKTFTATAILQLQEKGKLQISDPVVKYLPGFPYPGITIRHLLSHTSGLPSFDDLFDSMMKDHPDTILTNKDFVNGTVIARKTLYFQPGEKFSYNNANYTVLGIIVEDITGLRIDDYIDKNILKPAGMKHTFFPAFTMSHYSKKEASNLAIPYYLPHLYSVEPIRADTIPFLARYWHICNFRGFGEMVTTVEDLLNYDQALYNGKILSPASIEQAYTPVKLNNGRSNPGVWGLGWQIDEVGKMVNHGGGMAGMYSSFVRNIEKRQTAIVFSISHDFARPIANGTIKILNGQKIYPKKSLAYSYGKTLIKDGQDAASRFLEKAKEDTANYSISAAEFNSLGYDLMGDQDNYHLPAAHYYPEALQVFKLNTELFPASWNVYDSYGEALAKTGNKEDAIRMYKRSLELNPKNAGGAEKLKKLQ